MTTEDATDDARALRVDAERNRDRILTAARSLFSEFGLDVPMSTIAREAGVGKATLARRFPSKELLVAEVFADQMRRYASATDAALELAEKDPWAGFSGYVTEVCRMQAADRGFADVLTVAMPASADLEHLRAQSYQGFLRLISLGKHAGVLRDDFVSEDLVVLLMANAGVVRLTSVAATGSWKRLVGQFLRAVATPQATLGPLPPAPTSDELYQAMGRP